MGTRIHCVVEHQIDGVWRFMHELDLARDIRLFAVLAGVGGLGVAPIAKPRDLPTDIDPASEDILDAADFLYSWFTLAELRAWDWTTSIVNYGVIPLRPEDRDDRDALLCKEPYAVWRTTPPHRPDGFSGWREGTLSSRMYADAILAGQKLPELAGLMGKRVWVQVEWSEDAREACAVFYRWLMQHQSRDAKHVRIVFGFSSS